MADQDLFDLAIDEVGGKEWRFSILPMPMSGKKKAEDIENPIHIDDFVRGCTRSHIGVKTAWAVIEVKRNLPEMTCFQDIDEAIREGNLSQLPPCLRLAELPAEAKLNLVLQNGTDGAATAISVIIFGEPKPLKDVKDLVAGDVLIPVYRPGPWAVKKAFFYLFGKIPGFHVSWASVEREQKLKRVCSADWDPEDDEIDAAVKFVHKFCPVDEADSQMTTWIWKNIKPSSTSCLAGWPEQKVRRLADNKKKTSQSAEVHYFYPLNIFDLSPVWHKMLLPIVCPLLLQYGVLFLGLPGVGKTPTFICLAMMIGRFRCRGAEGKRPGWRRGKRWDDFKDRASAIEVAAFLDDPTLPNIDPADLKNFLSSVDSSTTSARYNDPMFVKSQFCGAADNEFDEDDEPEDDNRIEIDAAEFYKLVRKSFGNIKKAHCYAIMKRCHVCVAGRRAFYFRLPNECDDAKAFRITSHNITEDWLESPGNKIYLDKFYSGVYDAPEDFETKVAEEQLLLDKALELKGDMTTKQYVIKAAGLLREKILSIVPSPSTSSSFNVIPASPDSQQEAIHVQPDYDGQYRFAVPTSYRTTSERLKRFSFGDSASSTSLRTRLTKKQSPPMEVKHRLGDSDDAFGEE